MKKYLFLILCLFLLVGCNKKNNNQLVMVTEAGFAPYEYYENETIVGVDIDIAKEIAKEMGKELVVKDVYFNSIISELKSGKGDFAAAGMSITEDRLKQVDFSVEYAVSRQVVVVLKGSKYTVNDFKEGANLKNKKIAVPLKLIICFFLTLKCLLRTGRIKIIIIYNFQFLITYIFKVNRVILIKLFSEF